MLIAGVVLGFAVSPALAADEKRSLIYAEDFESDLGALVNNRDWRLPGHANLHRDEERQSQSLVIPQPRGDTQYARINIPVKVGRIYTIRYETRTVNVERDSALRNSRGAVVFAQFADHNGHYVDGGTFPVGLYGTNDWQERSFELRNPVPENAVYLDLLLGLEGTGEVYYDNLRVYAAVEPFSALHPANDATVDERRPELRWDVNDNYARYRLELSPTPDFDSSTLTYVYTNELSARPPMGLDPGEWHWRVRPWYPSRVGFKGGPSDPHRFVVSESASTWPPAVQPLGYVWAEGARRTFDVKVSPNDPDFVVRAWVNDVEAEQTGSNAEHVTFRPANDLEPGIHELKVEVYASGDQVADAEGILNNTTPGSRSQIGDGGIMVIDDEPFFPIGAFGEPSNSMTDFTGYIEAGLNMAFSYHSVEDAERSYRHLNKAHEHGIRVMLRHNSGWGYQDSYDLDLQRWVGRFMQHPALVAWYLGDEPELYGYSPTCIDLLREEMKATDPHTTHTLVSHTIDQFGHKSDVFMPMTYVLGPFWHDIGDPLDSRKMYSMPQGIGTARANLPEGHPQWAILQMFDPRFQEYGKDFDAAVEKLGPPSRPTYEETRCMAYTALAYDVQGIFFWYFTTPTAYNIRLDAPAVWDGIVRTSHELDSLQPYLVQPKADADVLELDEPLLAWTREVDGRRVMAVINTQIDPVSATINLSQFGVDTIHARESGEAVAVKDGQLSLSFESHQVRVFEWDAP
ncbi:hypothetical protein ACERK3_18600 [Phycisphaerales bacterium AB-hyl4]|uniref:Glycoside hydrolase family 2 catalytic domain-containing protein n=1 Tax=Natronomicrosphaera hydrolytica TaxID=3242702 RepID=A0ABV4UB06_9BACT